MQLKRVVTWAVILRLVVLMVERALGMDWDFHVDAGYYVDRINDMDSAGFLPALIAGGFENFLYALVGYLLWASTLGVFEPQYILIAFNFFCVVLLLNTVGKLYEPEEGIPFPVFFLAFSPYLMHLAVHPLKDTFFLMLGASTFSLIVRRRWFLAIAVGSLLVASRFYLGVLICFLLLVWIALASLQIRPRLTLVIYLAIFVGFFVVANEPLSQRLDVDFEGRDFYPAGLDLIPSSLEGRYFLGWLFNFLVPFPFVPSGSAEAGYFLHWGVFMALAWMALSRLSIEQLNSGHRLGLLLVSLFLFAFVLATTPGSGPLVRYRIFVELLFLLAISPSRIVAAAGHSRLGTVLVK